MTIELDHHHELMIDRMCQKLKEYLAFHLISYHADPVAIGRDVRGNVEQHRHEHFAPRGVSLHDPSLDADGNYELLIWDAAKIEEILEEAERGNYGFTRSTLPNGMPKDHFWFLNECGNVPRIGNH